MSYKLLQATNIKNFKGIWTLHCRSATALAQPTHPCAVWVDQSYELLKCNSAFVGVNI